MPTVLRWGPYRAFFYSNERGEPAHVHVRAGNPQIVARLRATLSDMMRDQAFTDHLYALGFEVRPLIGDDYRDFIVKDLDKWRAVAKAGNIKIEK